MKIISQANMLIFLLVSSFSVQSQFVLLEELFDDSTLGQFVGFSEAGDGEYWVPGNFGDKFYARMNGFNSGVQENIDWLISPPIDLSLYSDEKLTFENAANFDGPDLEVLISIDYDGTGNPSGATWTNLTSGLNLSPGGYEFVLSDIDLSAFVGTGYIAFKYTSNPEVLGKIYQVDSVVVSATSPSSSTQNTEINDIISTPFVSNDYLHFTVALDKSVSVRIRSINGSVIANGYKQIVSGDVSLPVTDLPSGIYILMVENEDVMQSFKFAK